MEEKKQITTIRESIRQEGWKGFMNRWSDGIKKISPDKLIESEMIGYVGMIIGTLISIIAFIWFIKGMWPIAIVMAFNLLITISQLIGKYQQLMAIKFMQIQSINIEEFLK
jgi:hypothetical protein